MVPRAEINVEIYGLFTFAFRVNTQLQAWFVAGCVVYKDKHGSLGLSMRLSRLVESEDMGSTMAYGDQGGILKGYRSRSPPIDPFTVPSAILE